MHKLKRAQVKVSVFCCCCFGVCIVDIFGIKRSFVAKVPRLYLPLILNRMCGMSIWLAPIGFHIVVAVSAAGDAAAASATAAAVIVVVRDADPGQNCDVCFVLLFPLLQLLRRRCLQLRWNGGRWFCSLRQCRKGREKRRRTSARIYDSKQVVGCRLRRIQFSSVAANYNYFCLLCWYFLVGSLYFFFFVLHKYNNNLLDVNIPRIE